MSINKRLFANTAANSFIQLWTQLTGFILLPFIIHHIGVSAGGIWLLVNTIIGYFGLLDLGITPSLTKYTAECKARDDINNLIDFINVAFFIFLGVGAISFIALALFGAFFLDFFNIPPELFKDTQLVTFITAGTLLIGFPSKTFNGVLNGLQRYDLSAFSAFAASIPRILLTIIFLKLGYGIVSLVLIVTFSNIISWALYIYYTKKLLPSMSIELNRLNVNLAQKMMNFSGSIFLIQLCSIVIFQMGQFVIGAFLTVSAVTYYTAALNLYLFVSQIPYLLSSAVMPVASELEVKNDFITLKNIFINGTKYIMAFFLSISIPIIFTAKQILVFWMGVDFGKYYLVTIILILNLFFLFNHRVADQLLVGINKLPPITYYYLIVSVSNFVISVILVSKIGVIGVALGMTIPFIILEPILMSYVFRTLDVNPRVFVKEVLIKTYPLASVVSLVFFYIISYRPPNNLVEVGIFGFMCAASYLLLFCALSIDLKERRNIIILLKGYIT